MGQMQKVSKKLNGRWPAVVLAAVVLTLSAAGCLNPQTTRLPYWQVAWPAAELAAWQQHYPFSDPDVGPDTGAEPRGFERPRSAVRRAAEQRVFDGIPAGPESVLPRRSLPRRRTIAVP